MLEFQLFRVKVILPEQKMFREPSRPEILRQAILSLPSAELRHGMVWHIGNVETIDPGSLYFRLGKTTTTTVEIFHEGKFQDQMFEAAPYTHGLLDLRLEVCAIAKKPRLSLYASGIANQFAKLLQQTPSATEFQVAFEINPIADPEDFISHLKTAEAISSFTVWFSQPNPFDVNRDFLLPAQRLVQAANGHNGKTELKGQHLQPNVLEEIARSAAATGDDAAAWLKPRNGRKRVKKRLRGSAVNLMQEHVDDAEAKRSLFKRMRDVYQRLRKGKGETQ